MRNRVLLASIAIACSLSFPEFAHGVQGSKSVASPFGGNGHNVSFDGRLYIVRRNPGWSAFVFRPQNVAFDPDGFPDMTAGAFSAETSLNAAPEGENALAICEADAAQTPYRCDLAGAADAAGAYDCYDLLLFDSNAELSVATMRRRSFKVWVRNPGQADAQVEKFETGAIEPVSPTLRGIEPTVTRDGKLMVWQGHPDNDGKIDILMYSVNADPCAAAGWSTPKSISRMHADAAVINRYPLADRPLRAGDGSIFSDGELFRGAYPWVFPDGEALLFAATNMPCVTPPPNEDPPGCGPRRNAISVVGYPTNWAVSNVDGGINPSRTDTVRLFFSSPGPGNFAAIPTTEGEDVWPFFGSNTSNYTELSFDAGLDGRYAGVWNMNELVNKAGDLVIDRTADHSGYFNTATLLGGAVMPPSNNAPIGKAVELDGITGRVVVNDSSTLSPLHALTVEMTLRPDSSPDCDGNNNWRLLAGKPYLEGTYSLVLEEDGSLQARVRAGGEIRSIWSNATLPIGAWSHVAFTYLASTGELAFFLDGVETNRVTGTPGTLDASSSSLLLGGPGVSTACPDGLGAFHGAIDEARISNVVRYPTLITGDPPPTPTPTGSPTPTPDSSPTPGGNDAAGDSGCACALDGETGKGMAGTLIFAALGLAVALGQQRKRSLG